MAPDFLKKPVVREWLQREEVENDFFTMAMANIMATGDDQEATRERLCASYADSIGEAKRYANDVIDSVVVILTGSYRAAIPPSQEPTAAMLQEVHKAVLRIPDKVKEDGVDPITQRAHDEKAKSDLANILEERMFDPDQARRRVLHLHAQLEAGRELGNATDATRANVCYWAARLCATDKDSLETAQFLRSLLPNQTKVGDLRVAVVDAFIAAGQNHEDQAMRLLRDVDDADARSVLFGLLVRFRGETEALEWCAGVDPAEALEHFTHTGWRNWALAMVKIGRWKEAARRLQAVRQNLGWEPSVAYVEGVVNAALLLPNERRAELDSVPFYRGMSPSISPLAEQHRQCAVACFEYLASRPKIQNDDLKAAIADWHLWLRLMNPSRDESKNAREYIRRCLENGVDVARLSPFAWAFDMTFDDKALRNYLQRRRQLGGLQRADVIAECLVNERTMTPRDFANFLEDRMDDIEQIFQKVAATGLLFGALLEDGQHDRARDLIMARESDLDASTVARMMNSLKDAEGNNPDSRRLLEDAYSSSGDLQDLRLLIRHLVATGDYGALGKGLEDMFRHDPSVDNAYELVRHWSRSPSNHSKVLDFLNQHPVFAEQHKDIQTAQAWALFHAGRLGEAQTVNDGLMAIRRGVDELELDLNLAIARGDWDRLPGIVARVWADRDQLRPDMLLRLADVACQPGQSPERAVELARLAATKAPEDARILVGAYGVHFRLGCDEQADAQWLAQAVRHSTDEEGPLWISNLRELVEHRMPAMSERKERIESMLFKGEAPISLAANMLNFPLSKLLLGLFANHADGRRRPVIPVFAGTRSPVDIEDEWTIGLDVTSTLILNRLGLLETAIDALDHVKIAPDLMMALYLERTLVRFHQPARVTQAQELKDLFDQGHIKVIEDLVVPGVTSEEVGVELASLFEEATREGGRVVCVRPVHKPHSYMEEVADTSAYGDIVCSPADICTALWRKGQLDRHTYQRAIDFLESQDQSERVDVADSLLEHPVYVQDLALGHLQSAKILSKIAHSLDLRVHQIVRQECESLLKVGGAGDDLAKDIDGIVAILRKNMERNAVSVLPRLVELKEARGFVQVGPLEGLVRAGGCCDALCVDDRWVNRKPFFKDSFGKTAPTICTLDVLGYLRARNKIDDDAYWASKHELRASGFIFVPLEAQELRHWLDKVEVRNGQVLESVELRTIRHALNATDSKTGAEQELKALSDRVQLVAADVARGLWMDLSVEWERVDALATWIWRHLGATTVLDSTHTDLRQSMVGRAALRMGPLLVADAGRRGAYRTWVEAQMTARFAPANARVYEEALRALYWAITNAGEHRRFPGAFFFECLPEQVKYDVHAWDPAFAEECGISFKRIMTIGDKVTLVEADLVEAAREVHRSGQSITVENQFEVVVTVQAEEVVGGVCVIWSDGQTEQRAIIPALGLLAPDSKTRRRACGAIERTIDPTGGPAREALLRSAHRALTNDEFALVSDEIFCSTSGTMYRLARKIAQQAPLAVEDLVPSSLDYWDRLCGPASSDSGPDVWIRDHLIPYRQHLLETDIARGLELCCLGAVHEDLMPGGWLEGTEDDVVWNALQSFDWTGNPIAALGSLDVAMYRLDDSRFLGFAKKVIAALLNDFMEAQEAYDFYGLLQGLYQFELNRLALVEECAGRPGCWRRMGAWMQASIILRMFVEHSTMPEVEEFTDILVEHSRPEGVLRGLADTWVEPWLAFETVASIDIRSRVFRQLESLKKKHESAGRVMPLREKVDEKVARLAECNKRVVYTPSNILDVGFAPVGPMPEDVVRGLADTLPDDPHVLSVLVKMSSQSVLDDMLLERMNEVVEKLGGKDDKNRTVLLCATVIAVVSGSESTADRVSEVLCRWAADSVPKDVDLVIAPLLLAAASRRGMDDRLAWLDQKLVDLAWVLPKAPIDCVEIFLECLQALEVVLPVEHWCHLNAKRIAEMA